MVRRESVAMGVGEGEKNATRAASSGREEAAASRDVTLNAGGRRGSLPRQHRDPSTVFPLRQPGPLTLCSTSLIQDLSFYHCCRC